MRFKLLSLFIFVLLGVIVAGKAFAVSPDSILVNVVPENPAPNETVTITLNSYSSNLDSVPITWRVDGIKSLSGIGKKTFSVNAPALSKVINVSVLISLPDGDITKTIAVRPAETVLLWQANDSYVPPFYKGKAMPSAQSEIKVVAMPEIKGVTPSSLIYTWKQDYNNMQDASGYGKNSFIYTTDYLDSSNNIDAVVSTTDQSQSSEANIDIPTVDPKIVFYKNDPKFGTLFDASLQDGHIIQGSEILEASPYFISPKDLRNPILSWSWYINDSPTSTAGFMPNLIPLKVQSGVSGTSRIKLQVNNNFKIFENITKEISVQF